MVWDVDPVLFQFGSFKVHYYGMFLAASFLFGSAVIHRHMRQFGYNPILAGELSLYGLIAIIVGCRVGQVLFYAPSYYWNNPIEIFTTGTGLASHGAFFVMATFLYIFHRIRKVPYLFLTDALSFGSAMALVCVRTGNLMNSEIVGRITTVPWALKFPLFDTSSTLLSTVPFRHPAQLYMVLWGVIVLTVLYALERRAVVKRTHGYITAAFFILFSSGRFVIEFFKENHIFSQNSILNMGQLLSVPVFLFGIGILLFLRKSHRVQ